MVPRAALTDGSAGPALIGRSRAARLVAALAMLLAACGTPPATPSVGLSSTPADSGVPGPTAAATNSAEPAPGSDSTVYRPNPGAIVVAIDPGHGGCLD